VKVSPCPVVREHVKAGGKSWTGEDPRLRGPLVLFFSLVWAPFYVSIDAVSTFYGIHCARVIFALAGMFIRKCKHTLFLGIRIRVYFVSFFFFVIIIRGLQCTKILLRRLPSPRPYLFFFLFLEILRGEQKLAR
jgi:hypothetical protein